MPDLGTYKILLGAAFAALVLILLWITAKAALPFAIGLICGAAAMHFWKKEH
jgi:hypothetical protein